MEQVSRGSSGLSKEKVNRFHSHLIDLAAAFQKVAAKEEEPRSNRYFTGMSVAYENAAELLREYEEGKRP
jgi:hypothetical protein